MKLLSSLNLFNYIKINSKKITIMLLLIIVFSVVAYFTWKNNGLKKLKEITGDVVHVNNKEIIKGTGKVTIYYFYTDWCPYCKKARPEWEKFKSVYEDKKFKGYDLEFVEVDCDKDENTASKFKVEGYPTIKLIKDGTIIDYDAKPKYETLELFLNSSL